MIPNPTAHAVDDTDRQKIDESAFPLADHGEFLSRGLTKREWFAAMAMQGLLSAESENWSIGSCQKLVETAVDHADALIKALGNEGAEYTEPNPFLETSASESPRSDIATNSQ